MMKTLNHDSKPDVIIDVPDFDVPDIPDRPLAQQSTSTQTNTSEDSDLDEPTDICCEVCLCVFQLISVILLAIPFCL